MASSSSQLLIPCISPGFRSNGLMRMRCCANSKTTPTPTPTPLVSSRVAPLLMVPADINIERGMYKLYNPAKDEFLPMKKRRQPDDAKLVGSSHGWLALFDEESNHVFLSNPISGQHVKLPAVDTLPDPDTNLLEGRGQVSRVALSCSPEDDECRALITFGPRNWLAFCAPRAAAAEWTPIGDTDSDPLGPCEEFERFDPQRHSRERNYEDFVYSSREGLFFCITEFNTEVEAWDLRDPLSPRLHWKLPFNEDLTFQHPCYPWPSAQTKKEYARLDKCFHPKYLVLHQDRLFIVVRHVAPRLRPDGSVAHRIYFFGYGDPWDHRYPYKTIGFDVFQIDRQSGKLTHMDMALEGLAVFVGMNHSFALSPPDFPHLKPDSIYFTDEDRRITPTWIAPTTFGGHDNGVFHYRDNTITSCCTSYYPVEYHKITRIVPPPIWFTPT